MFNTGAKRLSSFAIENQNVVIQVVRYNTTWRIGDSHPHALHRTLTSYHRQNFPQKEKKRGYQNNKRDHG